MNWFFVIYVISAAIMSSYFVIANNRIKDILAHGFQEESFAFFAAISLMCFVVVLITTFVPVINTLVVMSLMTGFNKNAVMRF